VVPSLNKLCDNLSNEQKKKWERERERERKREREREQISWNLSKGGTIQP